MSPRPAPDLDLRRAQITRLARDVAEGEGWPAVTVRRLSVELGVTQPVLYSAFTGRQDVIDAVALEGFVALGAALEAADATALARMQSYLDFAAAHPHTYEAMFSMPSQLGFAANSHEPLMRAFAAIQDVLPPAVDDAEAGEARAEVAWAMLHGLATLQASGRLPALRTRARLEAAHRMLVDTGRGVPARLR